MWSLEDVASGLFKNIMENGHRDITVWVLKHRVQHCLAEPV